MNDNPTEITNVKEFQKQCMEKYAQEQNQALAEMRRIRKARTVKELVEYDLQKNKGVLLFAKNNPDFNYIKQAKVSATLAKHFLNVPVALVTPKDELQEDVSLFDYVVDWKEKVEEINTRPIYIDGKFKKVSWHNLDRLTAYDVSPFEETLLIDSDYLIQNDVLNSIWGSNASMLMNTHTRIPAKHQQHIYELVIEDGFPKVHWFTVMYFRKCKQTQEWFDVAKYVKENYDFYRKTFRVSFLLSNDITNQDC